MKAANQSGERSFRAIDVSDKHRRFGVGTRAGTSLKTADDAFICDGDTYEITEGRNRGVGSNPSSRSRMLRLAGAETVARDPHWRAGPDWEENGLILRTSSPVSCPQARVQLIDYSRPPRICAPARAPQEKAFGRGPLRQ